MHEIYQEIEILKEGLKSVGFLRENSGLLNSLEKRKRELHHADEEYQLLDEQIHLLKAQENPELYPPESYDFLIISRDSNFDLGAETEAFGLLLVLFTERIQKAVFDYCNVILRNELEREPFGEGLFDFQAPNRRVGPTLAVGLVISFSVMAFATMKTIKIIEKL